MKTTHTHTRIEPNTRVVIKTRRTKGRKKDEAYQGTRLTRVLGYKCMPTKI